MGKRRRAREAAIQYHFWRDLQHGETPEHIDDFWEFCPVKPGVREFAQPLIEGMVEHLDEIDERIKKYCENYNLNRISAVDRNVLRLAIYEMLYRDDIPPVVSINEAIELAKTFGGAESGAFVNGILDRVRKRSPQDRGRAFEREFEKMFDTKKIALRLEEYQVQTVFLRTACVLLFVFLFLISPVLIRLRGLERIWPVLLAYLIWSLAWIGWSFLRAHRALYPELKEGRWQQVMVLALSPLSAIRANDVLLRDLFCAFHPLAVGHVLLSKEEYRVQADWHFRQALFRMDWNLSSSDAPMLRLLQTFLMRIGLPPEELLDPPPRESENCQAYCPLCLAQFVLAEGQCPDCGMHLKKFPVTPESAPSDRPQPKS